MDETELEVGLYELPRAKLYSTNPIERLGETKHTGTTLSALFPSEAPITRLNVAILMEQSDANGPASLPPS
ncbi:hypothetical protein HHL26_23180 [Sphingobium sp. TB-6]|nr:hypothetical protein [Sphingobium sp. TB-6]